MARKKIILIAVLAVLIALCGVGATLAFTSTYIERTNKVEVGNVRIETHTSQAGTTEKLIPGVPFDNENISIRNIGSYDAYIRIKVIYPKDVDKKLVDLSFRMKNGEPGRQIGEYYYLKNSLKSKASPLELVSTISLDSTVGQTQHGSTAKQVGPSGRIDFEFEVEAIQTDHLDQFESGELTGYPIWPDVEILDYDKTSSPGTRSGTQILTNAITAQ